jgi:hypothetical protein
MRRGLIIGACVVGVGVTLFAIFDPNSTLATVGFGFTISSALMLYVNDSLNKRIDDLKGNVNGIGDDIREIRDDIRENVKEIRDDLRGIDQKLQDHKHH